MMNANGSGRRMLRPRFSPGQVYATLGALAALTEAGQDPLEFLLRHLCGDWGDLVPEDVAENERALQTGARLFSAYNTAKGERIWVISDASEDPRVRETTSLILPTEY